MENDVPIYEWDEYNIGHIARHNVTLREAEQVFRDRRRRAGDAYEFEGEVRYAVIGETERGRLLVVVYTYRGERRDQHIRVVTARPARPFERAQYEGR